MKLNTMEKLYLCMRDQSPELTMTRELMDAARKPLMRMLELSKSIASTAITQGKVR
jgi:quinolinate synthase